MTITADGETATDRLVAKLRDPRATFTSAQMAYMMGLAGQWARDVVEGEPAPLTYRAGFEAGYRQRVAEENGAYPPEPVLVFGRRIDQVDYRRKCDAEARLPRETDFQGLGEKYVIELRERWAFPDGDHSSED